LAIVICLIIVVSCTATDQHEDKMFCKAAAPCLLALLAIAASQTAAESIEITTVAAAGG
jgi:hypothetical protein